MYIQRVLGGKSPVAESEQLAEEDAARERLVFALRRLEGIELDAFAAATGYDVDPLVGDELGRFIDSGLLIRKDGRLRLTRDGLMVSDALWSRFLRR
jgi:oxygen-independent coproporphyrinogen-3 oxidase